MTALNPHRMAVLSMYRQIMRQSFVWRATDPEMTGEERIYIRKEARDLFSKNSGLSDPEDIKEKLFEAETRYELAMHYRIPYPRRVNMMKGEDPQSLNDPNSPQRRHAHPAYMKSLWE